MSFDHMTSSATAAAAAPGFSIGAPVLTLTPVAAARINHILQKDPAQPEAVMISLVAQGCSGLKYDMKPLSKIADMPPGADVVTQHDATVIIAPQAALYIIGTVMDYIEGSTHSGFVFNNPNETGRCGCGESIQVGKA